ncbi:MAG TPA: aldo/keto reductase [Firmicutes bacterium]|nr:aldo/keto reductase [Bacillota bacterium]
MKYRTLGKDLKVSAVGLGCMGMSHAYGPPADKKEMQELLAQAVDLGCTFFDTAEVYGTPEHPYDNEELLGRALGPYRDKVVIATKFGIHFDESSPAVNKPLVPDSRPEVIRASVEGSLRRLGTDHIDLYYQHRVDPAIPIEEVAGVMSQLIQQGKITHWGLSEATEEIIRRAHSVCPVTAIQNRYSMMARQYETLFPLLEELHIGFVAFSPIANVFLSGRYGKDAVFEAKTDYRSMMPQFQPANVEQNQPLLALLRETAQRKAATPAQIALAWMLCKKPYLVPIPGTRKPDRLAENLGAAQVLLSAQEVEALDRALDQAGMSDVFGGTPMAQGQHRA